MQGRGWARCSARDGAGGGALLDTQRRGWVCSGVATLADGDALAGPLSLETHRLLLRPFVPEDFSVLLAYQSQAAYLRYYPEREDPEAVVGELFANFLHWQGESPRQRWQFAITLRGKDRLIGSCGVRKPEAGAPQAEFGCELDPAYWGQGLATEAGEELLRFAFTDLGLHRVWAQCIAENQAIERVLEKLGFRCEGRLRKSHWMQSHWWDSLIYAMLAEEWHAQSRREKERHG